MEKKLLKRVKQLEIEHPEATIQVWSMDEHRLGLKPVLRRVWVSDGWQPIAQVNWRFQWLWLYGFVQPESGETYWWILPTLKREQGTGNGERETECFKWGFIPKKGTLNGELLIGKTVPYSLFPIPFFFATYRSRGL